LATHLPGIAPRAAHGREIGALFDIVSEDMRRFLAVIALSLPLAACGTTGIKALEGLQGCTRDYQVTAGLLGHSFSAKAHCEPATKAPEAQ
jgi:hypothetical protein